MLTARLDSPLGENGRSRKGRKNSAPQARESHRWETRMQIVLSASRSPPALLAAILPALRPQIRLCPEAFLGGP